MRLRYELVPSIIVGLINGTLLYHLMRSFILVLVRFRSGRSISMLALRCKGNWYWVRHTWLENLWVVGIVGSTDETHQRWGICPHLVVPWNQSRCQAPSRTPYPGRQFPNFFDECLSLLPGNNSQNFGVQHMYRNALKKWWMEDSNKAQSTKHKAQSIAFNYTWLSTLC